jgi:exodeoxyribonuclease VII large subunit
MPEIIAGKKTYTLLDIAESIQRMFSTHYNQTYWVKAEMNKLNHYNHSGHCYPELLQKENGKTIVEFKSILWKKDYERINQQFIEQIKEPLKDGIKVLCEISVTYSPQYGLSLRIHDIDISYTLGDIEAERKEAIARLQHEGIFNQNKTKTHALLPKRIAVISVESSKGFADFQEIIDSQSERFSIFRMLFPALLQGDKAVESLIEALTRVKRVVHHFDAVAIIRGGGGDVGLSCFNNYELAHALATFPIPVYTGIGHATNETVCEMVSYYNGITPTKVAHRLLEQFEQFENLLLHMQSSIISLTREAISKHQQELHMHSRIIRQAGHGIVIQQHQMLNQQNTRLQATCNRLFERNRFTLESTASRIALGAKHRLLTSSERIQQQRRQLSSAANQLVSKSANSLEHIERIITLSDPKYILQRGYSITTVNGKSLREASQLKAGDRLVTTLMNGTVESEVTQINPQSE